MRRNGLALSIAGLLAAVSAGCAGARMAAPQTPVPVLLGPVPCIGCAPVPPAEGVPGPRIADNTFSWGGTILVPFVSDQELHFGKPPGVDAKVGAIVRDPCTGEFRISRLAAKSIGIGAILVWSTENRVEVEAVAVPVAGCGGVPAQAGAPAPPAPAGPPGVAPAGSP